MFRRLHKMYNVKTPFSFFLFFFFGHVLLSGFFSLSLLEISVKLELCDFLREVYGICEVFPIKGKDLPTQNEMSLLDCDFN